MEQPGTKERVQIFDADLMEWLKGDNFNLKEGEVLIYEDKDLMKYKNDNLDSFGPNVKNMNHAVEADIYHITFSRAVATKWINRRLYPKNYNQASKK